MTLARNAEDQEHLIACVRDALAKMDAGETIDPHAICRDHPHLVGPLAEVLGLTDVLPDLQQEALREDPLAGLVLAERYQLRACLGRGAMGVVYDAEDKELRRDVAVKILDARLFHDEMAEQRFQREAEALAALQHAHVVAVFDRGRTPEGIHYLVMERLEGATLAALLDHIREQGNPIAVVEDTTGTDASEAHWPRLCAHWACDLARGLAVAHERGLVHRDMKPSNVFLAKPGRVVLLDFGIATRINDERLTATQTTLGTPWYMAPEQISAGNLTAHATLDVYGLGATIYHLLAGHPPYEGDVTTVLAALQASDPKPLLVTQPDLPRDLVAIVEKCMERAPQRRYQDAGELSADLEAFLQHRPVTARPLSPFARRMRQWRRAPARPIAALAVLLTLLTAAIAGPILLEQRREALQSQKDELYRILPSVLAVEGWPNERVLSELRGEHEQAIENLDRILALDEHDLPVRLWRACLRLDLDDREGAASDLQAIASQSSSPYFRALAQRYASSDPEQRGTMAIDFAGLPEPQTGPECYVAGFHELRNRHVRGYSKRADELLAKASKTYLPARDLRLLSLAALAEGSRSATERTQLLNLLYEECIALEALYGQDTARTQAMRGVALLLMKRYEESVDAFERSIELRPGRHGPHQNLGIALKRLNRLDDSERELQRALAIRPFAWNTKYTLAQVKRARGDYAAAYEIMAKLPKTGSRGEARRHARLLSMIALSESVSLLDDDPEKSGEAARRAAQSCRDELAQRDSSTARKNLAIAEVLQHGERSKALVPFAKAILGNPDDAYHLNNLTFLMPNEGLDAEQTAWVEAILRRLAQQRAGGDKRLKERLQREIEAGLSRFR